MTRAQKEREKREVQLAERGWTSVLPSIAARCHGRPRKGLARGLPQDSAQSTAQPSLSAITGRLQSRHPTHIPLFHAFHPFVSALLHG